MITFINYWIIMVVCLILFLSGITILFGRLTKNLRQKHPKGYCDLGVCLMSLGFMIGIIMTIQEFI